MKKIIAFLAAIVAATPAQALEYTEEYIFSNNDGLVLITDTNKLKVNHITRSIWFTGSFYSIDRERSPIRVYPYLNDKKTEITFKTEEKETPIFIYDCNKTSAPHTYVPSSILSGGSMYNMKDNMCSKFFGNVWRAAAEEKEDSKRTYSLRLRYTAIGYMDIKIHPKDFRYDPEKDIVYVPWIARHTEGEVRYTVDGSWGNKTFHREDTFGRFLATPTGKYEVNCADTWKGRLSRHITTPYRVEDPHTKELVHDRLHHFTQNAICKYKDEYKEVYKP